MKKMLLFLLTLLLGGRGYAQSVAPSFGMASSCGVVGSGGVTKISQLVTYGPGGYYVTGSFGGTVTFGSYTLTSAGQYDVFVAKVDAAGNYQWVAQAGGSYSDMSYSLALDGSGNAYIAGTFRSQQAAFGSATLTQVNNGFDNTFVAKLSPAGTWLWSAQATNSYASFGDFAASIAVDAANNVYIAGQFSSQYLVLGTTTLTNSDPSLNGSRSGDPDLYVAKLSPAGTWLWAVSGGGTKVDVATALTLDAAGYVYLAGSFESPTAKFGTTTLTRSGYANTLVAKLDGAGNWLWLARAGGSAFCYPTSIAVDGSGQAYLTGQFTTSATFGPYTVRALGYYDIFVAKLGASGSWQWLNTCGGSAGSAGDYAYSLAVDNQGSTYVAGAFLSPTMFVGSTTLTNAFPTEYELCVAKLDAQGSWQWATRAGGSGSDIPASLALDGLGRIWVAGYLEGQSAQFGAITIAGNPIATYFLGFVARLDNQVLATQAAGAATAVFTVAPNPSKGTVWLRGLVAGQAIELYDLTGRLLAAQTPPAAGYWQWSLPPGIGAGCYLLRHGSQARRLVVE